MATFTAVDARRGSSTLLTWVHFQHEPAGGGPTVNYRWSHVTIPDVNAGLIRGRVVDWGRIIRALSDRQGRYEGSRFQWTLADVDRQILGLLDDVNQRYVHNRIATVHLITDAERRTGVTPLVIARGVVRDVGVDKRRRVSFDAEDYLATEFSTTNDDEVLPRRRISKAFFANCPDAVVGLPEPILYGEVDETGPDFHGLVPCIPVGTEVISSTTWTRFLIAGHAVKEIRALFINGGIWGGVGVDFLVPGHGGWPFGTNYRDLTAGSETRRYTLIYARGPIADNAVAGTAPLTANVYGIEDVGDSSGTLLTNILDQYRHWYLNFAIQDWKSGAWLANPPYHPVLDTTQRLGETSFTAAKAAHSARLGGGYPGAGIIGNNGDLRPKSEWIQAWNLSCDTRSGFNRAGQFIVVVPDAATQAATYTQVDDILADSFAAPLQFDLLRNVLPYNYRRSWRTNSWEIQNAKVKSQTSIDGYKTTREDSAVDLWFHLNAAAAENLMAHRLRRVQHPPRRVMFDTGIYGLTQTELGDTIGVTHADGPGGAGWTARNVFVERLEASPSRCTVVVEGFDLDAIGTLSYTTEAGFPGTGSGGGLNFGAATNPVVTVAVATSGPRSLGGDRSRPQTGTTFRPVRDYRVVEIDWSTIPNFNVRAEVESHTTNASNPVEVQIARVDANDTFLSQAALLASHTNTAWAKQSAVLPRGTGVERYMLRDRCTNSPAINTNAIGELKMVPI